MSSYPPILIAIPTEKTWLVRTSPDLQRCKPDDHRFKCRSCFTGLYTGSPGSIRITVVGATHYRPSIIFVIVTDEIDGYRIKPAPDRTNQGNQIVFALIALFSKSSSLRSLRLRDLCV